MSFALGPQAAAAGYRLTAYDSIGSTNSAALDLARTGDSGRHWLVSREQTAGRGRRGRLWHTPRGNLAATQLAVIDAGPPVAAGLGFVAGLALHAALARVAPGQGMMTMALDGAVSHEARFTLKWPNDVVAGGAKLAGILLECEPLDRGRSAVAVGLGVNVVAAPEGLPYPATSLTALGHGASAEAVFAALSDTWVEVEAVWDGGHGLPEIRRRWLACAAGLGAPVAVRSGSGVIRGVFETIDDAGRLIVRSRDGAITPIAAGEVHFGGLASLAGTE